MLAHELAQRAAPRSAAARLLPRDRGRPLLPAALPLARRRLVEEIEILCDDRAAKSTGDPAALASCLAEGRDLDRRGQPEARAIAMAAGRSRLGSASACSSTAARDRRTEPLFAPVAFALVASAIPLPAFAMRAASGGPGASGGRPSRGFRSAPS
jgi:hypothetical protein